MTTTREQRAADRRRRRGETDGSSDASTQLQDALRAAASAAAVGAAVGAARAYSARRHEDETEDEAPQPEPEATRPEPNEADLEEAEPEAHAEEDGDEQPRGGDLATVRGVVDQAHDVLENMIGSEAESVSFVARRGDGWVVGLVVVELRRIPESTDVLATYEIELDGNGDVVRFERARRYHRSEAERGIRA